MKIKFFGKNGDWREVVDCARVTIHKDEGTGEPSPKWKKQILLAEHSPIRCIEYKWKWYQIPYAITTHFVRHFIGILHWIRTERTDRTGVNRKDLSQMNEVEHRAKANTQALINISRKRLCAKADPVTRDAWKLVVEMVKEDDPNVAQVLVPECIYRGFCPEFNSCRYYKTAEYQQALHSYREGVNDT
jgi:hypothetical protein